MSESLSKHLDDEGALYWESSENRFCGLVEGTVFPNKIKRDICRGYLERHGLRGYAVLEALGDSRNGIWVYSDGELECDERPVQEWVNSVDGSYSGLVLCVSNPGGHVPASRESVLVVPDCGFGTSKGRYVDFNLVYPKGHSRRRAA